MSTLSDALAGRIQEEPDRNKPERVYSILAGGYIDKPAPMRKRGSYDLTVLDRDAAGRLSKMRLASLDGQVEYDFQVTSRDSQGRLVQLRITPV